MAGTDDSSVGQALWKPGGAEEDSRLREGNRHLHLVYDEEEEDSHFVYVAELPTERKGGGGGGGGVEGGRKKAEREG